VPLVRGPAFLLIAVIGQAHHDDALSQMTLILVAKPMAKVDQRHGPTLLNVSHVDEAFSSRVGRVVVARPRTGRAGLSRQLSEPGEALFGGRLPLVRSGSPSNALLTTPSRSRCRSRWFRGLVGYVPEAM
jgi:hypothetical protein